MNCEFRLHVLFHIPGFRMQCARVGPETFSPISSNGLVLEMTLVMPSDAPIRELEEAVALRSMLLNGVLSGSPDECTVEEELNSAIEGTWQAWRSMHSDGPYMLFTVRGTHLAPTVEQSRELHRVILAFGQNRTKEAREAAMPLVRACLASLHLVCPEIQKITEISSEIVHSTSEGKALHVMTPSFGVGSIVRAPVEQDLKRANQLASVLLANPTLFETPTRLLVISLDGEVDEFRSFLASWTALEALISKCFSRLSEAEKEDLSARVPKQAPRSAPVARQFTLADKFAIVTEQLLPQVSESLCGEFKRTKDSRDSFTHGVEIDDARLSARTARKILNAVIAAKIDQL
jgi:hypothetical protein